MKKMIKKNCTGLKGYDILMIQNNAPALKNRFSSRIDVFDLQNVKCDIRKFDVHKYISILIYNIYLYICISVQNLVNLFKIVSKIVQDWETFEPTIFIVNKLYNPVQIYTNNNSKSIES